MYVKPPDAASALRAIFLKLVKNSMLLSVKFSHSVYVFQLRPACSRRSAYVGHG